MKKKKKNIKELNNEIEDRVWFERKIQEKEDLLKKKEKNK